mgnify:CR=1 FL=1
MTVFKTLVEEKYYGYLDTDNSNGDKTAKNPTHVNGWLYDVLIKFCKGVYEHVGDAVDFTGYKVML